MAEEFYFVTDEEYNDKDKDDYVHPNARAIAEKIIAEWKKPDGHNIVLLKAQMQCGKTSVMRHICYLLNVKEQYKDLKLEEDNVHILVNIPDNALLTQTCDRMKGVMMIPALNVHHPANTFWKDESNLEIMKQNRVLIIDESHYGAVRNGKIAEICHNINSPLHYDKKLMKEKNVYVLLVSATPFSELGINNENGAFHVETLKPGPSYYGVKQMIDKKVIIDHRHPFLTFFTAKTPASIGQEMEKFLQKIGDATGKHTGFVFIRENLKSKESQKWIANFKAYLDGLPKTQGGFAKFTYFDLNQSTVLRNLKKGQFDGVVTSYKDCVPLTVWKKAVARASNRVPKAIGIDAVLTKSPDRTVFIFLKNMLLAGKTLDTPFVRMVVDIPYANKNAGKVDRLVQGLVGRCCGYGKEDDKVCIISNYKRIKEYAEWASGGNAPEQPSYRSVRAPEDSTKTKSTGTSAFARESKFVYGEDEGEVDEEPEDNGSSEDEEEDEKEEKPKKLVKLVKKAGPGKPKKVVMKDESKAKAEPKPEAKPKRRVTKDEPYDPIKDPWDDMVDDFDLNKLTRDWFPFKPEIKEQLDGYDEMCNSDYEWETMDGDEEEHEEDEVEVVDNAKEKLPQETGIVPGVSYVPKFLQFYGIDPSALFNEILKDKAKFFQPRDVNYMKYRGNEIKRTKAFVYEGKNNTVPVYIYPGFVYESVLHYATYEQYGGLLIQVKNIIQKHCKQAINHIIVTKYDQPNDCIGWHNDKIKTIADHSTIAVISLGAKRRFQLRVTPTETNKDPPVLKDIVTDEGSLIAMSYDANIQNQHCVAPLDKGKGDEEGTRVSIVFRNIKNIVGMADINAKVKAYHNRREAKKVAEEVDQEDGDDSDA